MRVGFVVYGSLDTSTGGYLYDRHLVDFLRANGDIVDVISLDDRGYMRNLLRPASRHADVDVLLEDELCHPSLRGDASCPTVSVVHLLRSDERRRSSLGALYSAVERRYLAGVDAAVFNSDATRASAERLVGRPLRGVVARPAADHLPDARVTVIPEGPGPLRVLCLANVLPGKGGLTLVDALAGLPAGTWHLTIAGSLTTDPAYVRRVRHRIEQAGLGASVDLVGEVPNDAVVTYLASHDAVAVPSSYEAAGIAYLEAMRMGRPVIATVAGGACELLDDGVEGFLVEPGNPDVIRERLMRWAADRGLLARMGEAAKERAMAHPTWAESLQPVRDLLTSLVGTRPRQAAP
jgi:glycosyltransferase involved in cell wall biosynthesis